MSTPSRLAKFLAIIAILATAIVLHELSHFTAARIAGVTVREFSIGIGPRISSTEVGGVTLSLRSLPVAAYVRMASHTDSLRSPGDVFIEELSGIKKSMIIVAGPLANLALVYVSCGLILIIGYRWPAPVIKTLAQDSILYESGLREGDRIKAINGMRVYTAAEVNTSLGFGSKGHTVELEDGRMIELPDMTRYSFKTMWQSDQDNVVLRQSWNPAEILRYGAHHLKRMIMINWILLKFMVTSRSARAMIGPVGQAQSMAAMFTDRVYTPLMTFSLVTASLGLFNLIPIPITDGGQLLMVAVESVVGTIPGPVTMAWNAVGFLMIGTLLLWTSLLDVARFVTSMKWLRPILRKSG